MLSDVIVITKDDYPAIFEAFETISHDCGGQAGHHNYAVPDKYKDNLPEFENLLNLLTKRELEDFCIGEETRMSEITNRTGYMPVNNFLMDFWENSLWISKRADCAKE